MFIELYFMICTSIYTERSEADANGNAWHLYQRGCAEYKHTHTHSLYNLWLSTKTKYEERTEFDLEGFKSFMFDSDLAQSIVVVNFPRDTSVF